VEQSLMAICFMTLLVLLVTAGIYVIRFTIVNNIGNSNAQLAASVLNALQIQIFNALNSFIAGVLTDRENHRYQHNLMNPIFVNC
jgi:hypothetical protein